MLGQGNLYRSLATAQGLAHPSLTPPSLCHSWRDGATRGRGSPCSLLGSPCPYFPCPLSLFWLPRWLLTSQTRDGKTAPPGPWAGRGCKCSAIEAAAFHLQKSLHSLHLLRDLAGIIVAGASGAFQVAYLSPSEATEVLEKIKPNCHGNELETHELPHHASSVYEQATLE